MMEPVGWFVWTEENGYEEVAKAFEGEEWTTPFVRLSDAEARIAELEARKEELEAAIDQHENKLTGSEDGDLWRFWRMKSDAATVRAEAAEALLKEAGKALGPFAQFDTEDFPDEMRLFEDTDTLRMHHFRAARANHDKIGVKDE